MRRRLIHISQMALIGSAMLGCKAVGPDYEPPVTPVPDGWTRALESEKKASRTGAERWWADFQDEDLNRLIAMAKNNNPDLKRGQARIEEAWQQRRVIRAAFFTHSDFYGRNENGLGSFDSGGVKWDPGS